MLLVLPQHWQWGKLRLVLSQDPQQSGKSIWCSERHFLSHDTWPICQEYCIRHPKPQWLTSVYRLLHVVVVKSLRRPQCILGQPRTSCGTSSFFLQFTTIAHVIQTIIYSAIWFELSNRTVTLSHVTRKVTRNHQTLGSFHMWDGLGMRLVADITSAPILRVAIM